VGCNVQEINTDLFFPMPQQLADLTFFFHDVVNFKIKKIIYNLQTLKPIAWTGDVGSTRLLSKLKTTLLRQSIQIRQIGAIVFIKQNLEECDARDDDSSTKAGYIKKSFNHKDW